MAMSGGDGELSTGKTVLALAMVLGCFAVMWPKIFYPMLTASLAKPSNTPRDTVDNSGRDNDFGVPASPLDGGTGSGVRMSKYKSTPHMKARIMEAHQAWRSSQSGSSDQSTYHKGSGVMGIVVPLYTVGMVIFFGFTLMKVVCKRETVETTTPLLPDCHLSSSPPQRCTRPRSSMEPAGHHHPSLKCTPGETDVNGLKGRLDEAELTMLHIVHQLSALSAQLQDLHGSTSTNYQCESEESVDDNSIFSGSDFDEEVED